MGIREHLTLKKMIELLLITALMDSESNGNYIKKSFLNKFKITASLKKQFYKLKTVNGININIKEKIIKKIFIKLNLKKHSKRIILDIIK